MKTRDFDPVLSAALRRELEALPGHPDPAPSRRPPVLQSARSPLWIGIATAVVLVAATLGVLRITDRTEAPAGSSPAVTSPLSRITDPSDVNDYVARAVRVLLDVRGTGAAVRTMDVPGDVTHARLYISCTPARHYSLDVDRGPGTASTCDPALGGWASGPVAVGRRNVRITVPAGVHWAVTIIAEPAPVNSPGALVDPLAQVRDRRVPDALTGDTTPLLRVAGSGGGTPRSFAAPTARLRAFLVCKPVSATTRLTIDGHVVSGCMNSIAHWFDFTPAGSAVSARVSAPSSVAWSLLVVPAPDGAKDSPENRLLPFPASDGTVLAHARGAGAQATGTYVPTADGVAVAIRCLGNGWVEVETPDGGTSTKGTACGGPDIAAHFGGPPERSPGAQRWTVTPHGDVSWAVTIGDDR